MQPWIGRCSQLTDSFGSRLMGANNPRHLDARRGSVLQLWATIARLAGADNAVTVSETIKETTRAARAHEDDLIGNSADGIAVSRQGRFIYLNSALASMLGFGDAADLLGREIREFVHPDDLPQTVPQQCSPEMGSVEREIRCRRFDGEYVSVEVSLTRFADFEGAPAVLAIARNIPARRRLRAQVLLADRLASIGMLAAGLAHEINNPLAALISNLAVAREELLQEGAAMQLQGRTARVLECLTDASEAADRIRHIVGDLKVLSRADIGHSSAVDLRSVLDSSVRMARHRIRDRAHLVQEYGDLPPVTGTEVGLGQVFLNLLINAAEAISEGCPDEHEIRVSARLEDAGRVVVEVKDTGTGIAPELRERIFEPFFTTKAVGKGTGLGLAICRRIVTEGNGRIDFESGGGTGSIFRVTLPTWQGGTEKVPP
jgi:two-component system, NtrC family, sensor kinase